MKITIQIIVFTLVLIAGCLLLSSPSSAMDGSDIARQVADRDEGQDATAKIRILLIDKNGRKQLVC